MASKIKLKPCPFCGGNAERIRYIFKKVFYVECTKCKCSTPVMTQIRDAVKLWNRRAQI